MNENLAAYNARRAMEAGRKKEKKGLTRKGLSRQPKPVSKDAQSAKDKARAKVEGEGRCRNPHCPGGGRPEWHHIYPRSRWGRSNLLQHSPDNAMPLCHSCHQGYHTGTLKFDRGMLLASEVRFIMEHAGEAWLEAHYPVHRGEGIADREIRSRR